MQPDNPASLTTRRCASLTAAVPKLRRLQLALCFDMCPQAGRTAGERCGDRTNSTVSTRQSPLSASVRIAARASSIVSFNFSLPPPKECLGVFGYFCASATCLMIRLYDQVCSKGWTGVLLSFLLRLHTGTRRFLHNDITQRELRPGRNSAKLKLLEKRNPENSKYLALERMKVHMEEKQLEGGTTNGRRRLTLASIFAIQRPS